MPTVNKKNISKFSWSLFGSSVEFIFTFLLTIFVARPLGPNLYGYISLVSSIIEIPRRILVSAVGTSYSRTIARHFSKDNLDSPKIITSGLVFLFPIMAILSLLIFFSSSWLSELLHNPHLQTYLKIASLVLFGQGLLSFFQSSFQGLNRIDLLSVSQIVYCLTRLIFTLILFYKFSMNVENFLLANVLSCFLTSMFAFPVLSKIIKNVVSKPNKFYIEEIFKYAIPLLLSTLAFYGNTRIDVFLIGLFNVDQAEIGNYGMANALFSVFFIVAISASTAFFPLIAKYYKDQDNLRLNKLFSAMIFLVLVFTIPVFIIINFLSKPLINLVLPNFSETSLFLKYLSPLVILRSLGIICTSGFLIPTGNAKFVARLNLIAAICNICLDLFFIPRFGVLGSIIATLVAHGGIGVISMTLLFKYFDLKTDLRIFPFLISGFIMMLFIKASQMITTSENSIYIVFLAIISIIIFYIAFLLFYGVKEIKVFLNQEISTKFAKI